MTPMPDSFERTAAFVERIVAAVKGEYATAVKSYAVYGVERSIQTGLSGDEESCARILELIGKFSGYIARICLHG